MKIGGWRETLLRRGSEDARQMSTVLGVLYLSGGVLVLLSLLFPHPGDVFRPGLYGIVAVGFLGGTAGIVYAKHARMWTVHAVLAAGTVFICLCEYFAGVGAGVYAGMFVWVVLMAASFFSRRAVAAHVLWVLVSWGVTLAVIDEPTGFPALTRWVLGGVVLTVAALVMADIVAARRSIEEERERLQHELVHMAHHDALTGVPNRRLFEQQLERELARASRSGATLCLAALDLDHFKAYNDREGHVAGDRLLKATTSAWSNVLRAGDMLARMGGDEFVALLPDCDPGEAHRVADRLASVVPLGQHCSTGVACWDGRESAETLLGRADKAMYVGKIKRPAGPGRLTPDRFDQEADSSSASSDLSSRRSAT